MGWQEAIGALEARLRAWVQGLVLEIVDWRPGVRASSDGLSDAVAGLPADESYQSDVRRVQHAGFRSRMSQTAGNVIVRRGTRWFSIAEDDGLAVSPDDGDAIHYAPGNTASQVKCASDGSTAIASDTAGGKDTTVNGGALKVARDTDPVDCGTLSFTSALIGGTLPTVYFLYTPQGKTFDATLSATAAPVLATNTALWFAMVIAAMPSVVGPAHVDVAITGIITDGAANFKA